MPYKYKLKEGFDPKRTFIPNVRIAADGTAESSFKVESRKLELIGEDKQAEQAPAPAPEPAQPVQVAAPEPKDNIGVKINV